ncbi:hypothetical protein H0H87_000701 [Tephrocybe sp. NHM501043]|nr:hypothetical protein H0H87_000701 [Tephrocybe sp. NHM501043]
MSDDDAYFTDDICFDDQTLAFLDSEEKKFLSQATKAVPPTKRQKTDNGWKPGIGAAPAHAADFLPEISLDFGGSYGVLPGASTATRIAQLPPASSNSATSRVPPNHALATSPGTPLASRALLPSSHNLPARIFQQGRPPVGLPDAVQRPVSREAARLVCSVQPLPNSPPQHFPSSYAVNRPPDKTHELEAKLQQLQQKLEKVCEENKTIQVALNDALNAKFAKEGEVTILRKNAEKVAQEHAAQLAKLKSAREEADVKQARMQKELREEAERLKTQLIFKQHEQESALRPPPSVRPKKIFKDGSLIANSTPARLRKPVEEGRPSAQMARSPPTQTYETPQSRRTSMLPGFENAFNDATPLPASRSFGKGKRVTSVLDPISPTKHRHIPGVEADVTMDGFTDETFMESTHIDLDGDIDMPFGPLQFGGTVNAEKDQDIEELTRAETPDWKVELNRMVLMHSLPGFHTVTIQLLFGAQITSNLDDAQSNTYLTRCSRCLEVLATPIHCELDWRYSVETLSQALISLIPILRAAHSFLPLAALLNLLAVLVHSLPDFGTSVLSCNAGISNSQILVHLCGIILDQRENEKQEFYETLATEVVTLLETLSFSVDSELVEKLTFIVRNRQVLMNLFRANQPSWLLARSARLLVILGSHRSLCRWLLAMPEPELAHEEKVTDPQKIPLIERLCLYLMDAGRKDNDYKEAKTSILTFFALLSNSQPDVHAHLLTSTTVIPSLVYYLAQLTAAFWEDDEDLLSASSEAVAAEIQALNQTLFLLHHLVFTSVSFVNLRQKLHAPYHRIFNGLMHMFIVTFGRLSYGEAPEWIDRQGRIDLVSSTDMARDILDHVVDGPEADRTWQAFQPDEEKANETDEEEMEVQLLGKRI